ncbi:hypothetical protein L584_02795 [Pantoea agglomerans Tx10]|nr:hypothetical protein L584_02795 [Pantoea agglomerans Tx10]
MNTAIAVIWVTFNDSGITMLRAGNTITFTGYTDIAKEHGC